MKISTDIDLGRSLRQVFGNDPASANKIGMDRDRQTKTATEILKRFFASRDSRRRECVILADEVGLGKTYVAIAVAVSLLDMIRRGDAPEGLPSNRPAVLVLTPGNDALFNKWLREAEAFQRACARRDGVLDWVQIDSPIGNSTKSGNVIDLTRAMRNATRSKPMLMIAKIGVLGARLHDVKAIWRRRALACIFKRFRVVPKDRRRWCRQLLDSGSKKVVGELLDLRKSSRLWKDAEDYSPNLYRAYQRALNNDWFCGRIQKALAQRNGRRMTDLADDLTRRALVGDWSTLPLVIIDEIHNLKNKHTQARRRLEGLLEGQVCRLLGLSATPFQLRHDELLSVLNLRSLLSIHSERSEELDTCVSDLADVINSARNSGDAFRRRWLTLRAGDRGVVCDGWKFVREASNGCATDLARQVRPPRVAHALEAALELEQRNADLTTHLRPFVIRHQRGRNYREHFVGKMAESGSGEGSRHFAWAPGMEVRGSSELAHYLMMRAVSLAKEEKGLPGLGAELTGSYRHLVETAAVWKKLAAAKNPLLPKYRDILAHMIAVPNADRDHRKVQATVRRTLEFFRTGQKTLIFCVFTKTAETLRDQLQIAISHYLHDVRDRVFGGETAFENFRRRFFNRREPLYSLIQDHPLLGRLRGGATGVPSRLRLGERELRKIARILLDNGERPDDEKPDRRLLLAATEHVAVQAWQGKHDGCEWLDHTLWACRELEELMADSFWLNGREPLSRSEKAGRVRRALDPEAARDAEDPLALENEESEARSELPKGKGAASIDDWVARLRKDALGDVIAPYFRSDLMAQRRPRLPILAHHHTDLLVQLSLRTREVAGQVFRRILMAGEFLLRYLADVPRDQAERWADYLADRYTKALRGHQESLSDRVAAYLETLVRARKNRKLLQGYYDAAENRNVVQLVRGGMSNRDRYFLGFNTPYRPEIIVSTSVGQEGIDLHRECRHVIHHDLCWNPATVEQRTGRVDRIGSKVERERVEGSDDNAPTLEIVVPYLAATYDERMFEELYRRAQLFEVTMGGDIRVEGRVEGRIDLEAIQGERKKRQKLGIGTENEDLGQEGETGTIELPRDMVERLRVDLSVWRPGTGSSPCEPDGSSSLNSPWG